MALYLKCPRITLLFFFSADMNYLELDLVEDQLTFLWHALHINVVEWTCPVATGTHYTGTGTDKQGSRA